MTGDGSGNRTVEVPYRVRFDECGPDGRARTSMLLRYAQDVAWIHSEQLGFDRAWYARRGLTWLVRAARVVVLRPVPLGTTLSVATTVVGFRRVWARRRTDGTLPDGSLAFWAHTDWVIVDERGRPSRVPAAFPNLFGTRSETFEPGRVALEATPGDASVVVSRVRPTDLDPLGHMNNAAYLDYLDEGALGAGPGPAAAVSALPRTLRVEYLAPARQGALVRGAIWAAGPGPGPCWAWRLADDEDGELARGTLGLDGGRAPELDTDHPSRPVSPGGSRR